MLPNEGPTNRSDGESGSRQTGGSLTISRLGRSGDGVADGPAGPVFVPRSLPGEVVEIASDGTPRILTPVPDRVRPPCRHFKSCGGCAMQHASDTLVAEWKVDLVRRALTAQGLAGEVGMIHTSPPRSRRRARFSGRRTKSGALVGFHARASDMVVAVPDCELVTPAILATLSALEEITQAAASRRGEIALTVTETAAGPDILVEAERDLPPDLRVTLADLAERHGLARLVWGAEPVAVRAPPAQRFGSAMVTPPPGAFLQATRQGEAALVARVRALAGDAARIVDLFAGCGTFTLPLAERAEVHAVEGERAMLDALDRGWRSASRLRRVTTEARDLFRRPLLPDELARFDAIVIDPPRAGAEAQIAQIAATKVRTVVMVSCNPVTFARDARTLITAGFAMEPVAVVDQFRWSDHVELVSRFARS